MFILTGVSGVGKTAILKELQARLDPSRFACHDIDEGGVPDGVDHTWRKRRAVDFANEALRYAEEGRSLVLSATLYPEDIAEASCRSQLSAVHYCLLEINDTMFAERLAERFDTDEKGAHCLRITGMSPENFIARMPSFQNELRKCYQSSDCDWIRFDTSGIAFEDSIAFVAGWIVDNS